jgi:hypothetical protein
MLKWILALCLTTPLQAQLATTTCADDGGVRVWISKEAIHDPERLDETLEATLQHEMVHVRQAARFDSCQASMDQHNASALNAVANEVEAYCATLQHVTPEHRPLAYAMILLYLERATPMDRPLHVPLAWRPVIEGFFHGMCPDVLPPKTP